MSDAERGCSLALGSAAERATARRAKKSWTTEFAEDGVAMRGTPTADALEAAYVDCYVDDFVQLGPPNGVAMPPANHSFTKT